jgi:hypothetical protein
MSITGQAAAYARFALGLRRYLQEPATPELGRALIRERLRDREANLLTFVRHAVYGCERSPYLALLRIAGCEYGDLERMVCADGVEGSLERLRDAGVFLSTEEFRCTREVVRGSATIPCVPDDFNNPFLLRSIATGSSGSRGLATRTTANLDRSRYNAMCYAAMLSAHGLFGSPTVLWRPILPSSVGLGNLLSSSKMGVPPERWFSPVSARAFRPSLAKRLATHYIVYAGRLFGSHMPIPQYVSGEQTDVVVDYLLDFLRSERRPIVFASVSSATRACQFARAKGHELTGVTFFVGGEPLTSAKLAEIISVGARVVSQYACAECGIVGLSCAGEGHSSDDVHLLLGSLACIPRRRETRFGGGSVDAFLFTSLADKAPKVLLNVEVGDYGVIETRECGCELGALGLTTHIHTIRSFEKLTGEGMTFVGSDMLRIIEEILPAGFGGSSVDYQMVEHEEPEGRTRVEIVISPGVGDIDPHAVRELVLTELGKASETHRMMAEVWRQRGMLQVVRRSPYVSPGGKQLPLYIAHRS